MKFPFEIPGWFLILLATSALAIGFWARYWFIQVSEKALASEVEDKYLHRWYMGQLISAVYAEFIATLGLVWRLQGWLASFRSRVLYRWVHAPPNLVSSPTPSVLGESNKSNSELVRLSDLSGVGRMADTSCSP
jgi:hypothetical protein